MLKARVLTAVWTALILWTAAAAAATKQWKWSYSGIGISAAGTFTTAVSADAGGDYLITAITGERNGLDIAGLTPTGTANPGNEPYAVDNLIAETGAQLTNHGFGFELSNGYYANPFNSGGYLEYLSVPPYLAGVGPETQITFSASPVPEPSSFILLLAGAAGVWTAGLRRRRSA